MWKYGSKLIIRSYSRNKAATNGPCNGIMEDVPVENAITMHLACEKYGHYPIA
jgi:hypothetical protein